MSSTRGGGCVHVYWISVGQDIARVYPCVQYTGLVDVKVTANDCSKPPYLTVAPDIEVFGTGSGTLRVDQGWWMG